MVSLKLQSQDVAVTGEVRRHLGPSEGSQNRGVWRVTIFNSKEVKLGFQVKVVEGKMDPAPWIGDYRPDAI